MDKKNLVNKGSLDGKNPNSYTGNKINNLINGANVPQENTNSNQQIDPQKVAQEFERLKNKLEGFKKNVLKKCKFTRVLCILPPNASFLFEEDESIPLEVAQTKPLHVLMVIPEDEYKNIPKIKPEILKFAKETKENLWVHIKTEVDLWNYGLDSKFEFLDAISGSFPLHDNGFLGALRVANIHKTLVLRKFDKYVASYVIAGSLVRGTAGKDSDVDVFVVVDDTDVKRMPRLELLEKLRGIIYDYIREATALAGVTNVLNVQVYLLTDFWQNVKDAHPLMFTFIRDGIPLHDRGTFIPWKLLLLSGRIKPSPEAIDLYMKEGDRTDDIIKRKLMDSMVEIYFGVVTPTQAMLMLAGEAPPVPKIIVQETKKVFVDREKLMSEKDLKTLERCVGLYKSYEYGKLKEISGKEIDELMKDSKEYNKMLKELRKKLEKKMHDKGIEETYNEVFNLLKTVFGDNKQGELIKEFESKLVKKGKISSRYVNVLKNIVDAKSKVKTGKLSAKEVDSVKKDAFELIRSLTEYAQRLDLITSEKGTMQVIYGNRKAELVLLGKDNFMIEGRTINKISNGKIVESNREEFEKALEENKGKLSTKISAEIFNVLEKELGNFEIVF